MLYAVRIGRKPGVYETWDECKEQVNKFSGAEYRKVKTREEGDRYINEAFMLPEYGYYIDGSYQGKTNSYGYSVVICDPVVRYQEFGSVPKEFRTSRNIGAELYASLRALKIIFVIGEMVVPTIYYDYEGLRSF